MKTTNRTKETPRKDGRRARGCWVKGLSTGHPLTWGQAQKDASGEESVLGGDVPGQTQKKAEQRGVHGLLK